MGVYPERHKVESKDENQFWVYPEWFCEAKLYRRDVVRCLQTALPPKNLHYAPKAQWKRGLRPRFWYDDSHKFVLPQVGRSLHTNNYAYVRWARPPSSPRLRRTGRALIRSSWACRRIGLLGVQGSWVICVANCIEGSNKIPLPCGAIFLLF